MTEEKKSPEAGNSLKLINTTLKELGAKLPLGMQSATGYAKDIVLRPWTMVQEKELGKLRAENEGDSMGQFVSMILATLCTQLAHHNLDAMKFTERRAVISQMWMGDVFYVYMWLRLQNLGTILPLELRCPNCNRKFNFNADMETTEVVGAETVEVASWEQKLEHPIVIRSKKIEGFKMGPPRWSAMEAIGDVGADSGSAKSGMIAGSICGVMGTDDALIVSEAELNSLVKIDIERLTQSIEDHDLGPNMSVDAKCTRCKREAKHPMNWGYDSFFGVSSQ